MKRFLIGFFALIIAGTLGFTDFYQDMPQDSGLKFHMTAQNHRVVDQVTGTAGTMTDPGTNKTFIDPYSGLLRTVGANTLRRQKVGGHYAWLLEPAGANICLQSRDFTNATGGWTLSNCTSAADAVGVFGVANTGSTITDADGSNIGFISRTVSKSATDVQSHGVKLFLKKETTVNAYPAFGIAFTGVAAKIAYYVVNPITGTLTAGSTNNVVTITGAIKDHGAFFEVDVTAVDNGANTGIRITYAPAWNEDGTTTINTAAQGSNVIDCAQIEYNKSYLSSYIDNDNVDIGADLASGWDFTSGWAAQGTAGIDDLNSFTTVGGAGGVSETFASLTSGKVYKFTIAGSSTASSNTVRAGTTGDVIATSINAVVYFIYMGATGSDNFYIRNSDAGTTDITTLTIEEHGTVRLTEAGALTYTNPASLFSADFTLVGWWRPIYDEADLSTDNRIISAGTAKDMLYHDVSGNGIAIHDSTTEISLALSFVKNTWYKFAVKAATGGNMNVGYDSGSGITWGTPAGVDAGFDETGGNLLFGTHAHFKSVALYDRVLTDAEIDASGSPM